MYTYVYTHNNFLPYLNLIYMYIEFEPQNNKQHRKPKTVLTTSCKKKKLK